MRERFVIYLDKQSGHYVPGEDLSGHVKLQIQEEDHIKGLTVKVTGKAKVLWTERERKYRTNSQGKRESYYVTVTYSKNEQYLRQEFWMDNLDFSPGQELQVPFNLTLPPSLPSSFEGEYGKVHYKVKIAVRRSGMRLNFKNERLFTVKCQKNLNHIAGARKMTTAQKSKRLGCLCCLTGPINAHVSFAPSAYVPGEILRFFTNIDNNSGKELMGRLKLERIDTFYAGGKTKTSTKCLVAKSVDGHVETWGDILIRIPMDCPPSNFPNCRFIDVTYRLKFTIVTGAWHSNMRLPMDVIIGSIPFDDEPLPVAPPMPMAPPMPITPPMPMAPPMPALPSVPPMESMDLPPPYLAVAGPPAYPTYPPTVGMGSTDMPFPKAAPPSGYPVPLGFTSPALTQPEGVDPAQYPPNPLALGTAASAPPYPALDAHHRGSPPVVSGAESAPSAPWLVENEAPVPPVGAPETPPMVPKAPWLQ